MGGEIKTRSAPLASTAAILPNCPVGGEIKTRSAMASVSETSYQIAPWGARSKRHVPLSDSSIRLTKLPRGGRDQNVVDVFNARLNGLPNCPVGGEIKTATVERCWPPRAYQIAPWGARSKQLFVVLQVVSILTKLPRGGRDQNVSPKALQLVAPLPNCPVGGEIKTPPFERSKHRRTYQIAPWGARSKLCDKQRSCRIAPYQIAPWGARSKRRRAWYRRRR